MLNIIKLHFLLSLFCLPASLFAQEGDFRMKNRVGYSDDEIAPVLRAFDRGIVALRKAYWEVEAIWTQPDHHQRIELWNQNENLVLWLGEAHKHKQIATARKRLKKMNRICQEKKIYFDFQIGGGISQCVGTKHAWTIPKGRAVIHLCPNFMYLSSSHQAKAFVHEIGHESGMFFHRKIYWRGAALRAAREDPRRALRNPENYAFLVMSYYSPAGRDEDRQIIE